MNVVVIVVLMLVELDVVDLNVVYEIKSSFGDVDVGLFFGLCED